MANTVGIVVKKRCPTCRRSKAVACFYRAAAKKDGYSSICKICSDVRRAANKARNIDRERARARQYYHSGPQQKKLKRLYYEANKAASRERTRKWYRKNKIKAVEKRNRRRARLKNAFVEHVDRRVVHGRDGGKCYLCKRAVTLAAMHLEHVIPLDAGGKHCYANCRCSCGPCNLRKGAKEG